MWPLQTDWYVDVRLKQLSKSSSHFHICSICNSLNLFYFLISSTAPEFEFLAKKHHRNCVFLKVDVDANRAVASRYSVTSMPTFCYFHKGTLIQKTAGGAGLSHTVEKLANQYAKDPFAGQGNVLGGSSGKRVNPWADPNFKPGTEPSGDHPTQEKHKHVEPSKPSHPTHEAETEVVCEGDICAVRPKAHASASTGSEAAPASSHPPASHKQSSAAQVLAERNERMKQREETPKSEGGSTCSMQ